MRLSGNQSLVANWATTSSSQSWPICCKVLAPSFHRACVQDGLLQLLETGAELWVRVLIGVRRRGPVRAGSQPNNHCQYQNRKGQERDEHDRADQSSGHGVRTLRQHACLYLRPQRGRLADVFIPAWKATAKWSGKCRSAAVSSQNCLLTSLPSCATHARFGVDTQNVVGRRGLEPRTSAVTAPKRHA